MQAQFVGQVGAWVMWVSLGALFYTYLGFPALIWAMSRLFGRAHEEGDIEPEVSLLIPAHNESVVIRAKIENSLALDYPRDKLHVHVISDGSDVPLRCKARSPCFTATSSIDAIVQHSKTPMLIADIVATVASFDIVLGEIDR